MTTEYRQAVECEARNPCIHDHDDIKSAEGTTEDFSVVPTALGFLGNSFLQAFRTLCSIPAYILSLLRSLFGCYMDFWVLDFWLSTVIVQSSEFKKKELL